ncbi:MAG: protein-methionine-sulfoxide reductase catalytic subunit MsrP [Acaryochloridaceae cyanobacterium CSU_5_19]|nr:protein-methionine-sulfoxide reductase catalytic subunit MsrP [Acaryochloridaceae cyanobacterium CSU_5_19]
MVLIRIPQPWQVEGQPITSETFYWQRRRFLKSLVGFGLGASILPGISCARQPAALDPDLAKTLPPDQHLKIKRSPVYAEAGLRVTPEADTLGYQNFYEFGTTKNIWQAAQRLPSQPWQVEVSGLVNHPQIYDLEDLTTRFPLEERIYRFRCVEAWAMVVPWLGFPMRSLLKAVDPKPNAKFVRFTSFYDPKITLGPGWQLGNTVPWPYTESLRIEEMAHELAFFAVGIYGHLLPKQHGAPIRMVVPWKYGFKGAKSLVKIEFMNYQPPTFWNALAPEEYGFEANVNPQVAHPRWSQAEERLLGTGLHPALWEKQPTLLYNGYSEVAPLYQSL